MAFHDAQTPEDLPPEYEVVPPEAPEDDNNETDDEEDR